MSISLVLCVLAVGVQFILGSLVLAKGYKKKPNQVFSVQLSLFALWTIAEIYLLLTGVDAYKVRFLMTPGIILAYFFCVFSAMYPEYQKDSLILKSGLNLTLFSAPAVLALYLLWTGQLIESVETITGGFTISLGKFEFLFKGIIVSYLLYSLSTLSNSRKTAKNKFQKRRLRYTFTAMLLPVAAGSMIIAAGRWLVGGGTAYSFGLFPVLSIIMGGILAYTMLKYNLLDIDIIFSTGLVYTLLTAILAGCVELLEELMQDLLQVSELWTKLVTVLLIAGFMSPLKDLLITLVDRFFGKKSFDSASVLKNIVDQMHNAENETELFNRMVSELRLVLDLSFCFIRVKGLSDLGYDVPEKLDSQIKHLDLSSFPEGHNDIEAAIEFFREKEDSARVESLQALKANKVCNYFLLKNEKDNLGILLLGSKKTRIPYNESELNLVSGVCSAIPFILDNLQMIRKLLEQDRSIQEIEWAKKMVEAIKVREKSLKIGDLEAVHFSSLSKEIKGDLIDYCADCSEPFIGLYDAFHHGIQAVLTLNVLFSVFRANKSGVERFDDVNKILRTFSDQKLCSAVTMVRAVERRLKCDIAGNPAPVVVGKNSVRELEIGQTRPLGLENEAVFKSLEVEIDADEFIVVSTNGLYKAFEKIAKTNLATFLKENNFAGPEDCREKIINKLGTKDIFKFDDDITFIVIG